EQLNKTLKQIDADGRRMSEVLARLNSNPQSADLRFECAMLFLRNGVVEDAVHWLRLTVEAKPDHLQAHEQLAACYDRQGKTTEAAAHRAAARRLKEARR